MDNSISNYLNSNEFYEIVYRFRDDNEQLKLENIISLLMDFSIELFLITNDINLVSKFNIALLKMYLDNKEKYWKYISRDDLFMKDVHSLFDNYVKKGLKLNQGIENDDDIINFLYNKLGKYDWKFHAFNSNCLDSIKKHGINPNINFTPQQEIDEINEVFEKHGVQLIFGWQKLNCENKVYYSGAPNVSYRYGLDSPEWFSQFVGGANCHPEKEDKFNFRKKNYNRSLNCIKKLIAKKELNDSEKTKVIDFFKKYWNVYAINSSPMLAITKSQQNQPYEVFKERYISFGKIADVCFERHRIDEESTVTIDTSDAMYISMPKYDEICRYIENRNKKDKVKLNISYSPNDNITEYGLFDFAVICDIEEYQKFLTILNDRILKYFGKNSPYLLEKNTYVELVLEDEKINNIIVPDVLCSAIVHILGENEFADIIIGDKILSGKNMPYDECLDNLREASIVCTEQSENKRR